MSDPITGREIFIALTSGALSGIVSPLVLSWIQHNCIWKSQKKLEVKYSIFNDAVRALSLYATDASDPKLQSLKATLGDIQRQSELRSETVELMEKSRQLVAAFFSKTASDLFSTALDVPISIESGGFYDFQIKQRTAIVALSEELGIK